MANIFASGVGGDFFVKYPGEGAKEIVYVQGWLFVGFYVMFVWSKCHLSVSIEKKIKIY